MAAITLPPGAEIMHYRQPVKNLSRNKIYQIFDVLGSRIKGRRRGQDSRSRLLLF
jgi:hypothetical protein